VEVRDYHIAWRFAEEVVRGTSWRVWIETLGVEEGPHA